MFHMQPQRFITIQSHCLKHQPTNKGRDSARPFNVNLTQSVH